DTIQDGLDGNRITLAPQIDLGEFWAPVERDRSFADPIADTVAVEQPPNVLKLADGQPEVRPGRTVRQDLQRLCCGYIDHWIFLSVLIPIAPGGFGPLLPVPSTPRSINRRCPELPGRRRHHSRGPGE